MAKKELDAVTRAKNLEQQKNKTPELAAAKKALQAYYKEHHLDPTKDHTKDPEHGRMVAKLIAKLNLERDKIAVKYPLTDRKVMAKIKKDASKKVKNEVKVDKLQKHLKEEKTTKEAKAKKEPRATKYDYPLIDGREMTSIEKKKYRMEQRKLKSGGSTKSKAEKEAKVKADPKAEKKSKKVEKAPKAEKKSKKASKDED